jgi:predicted nicotinamide N-methyase
MFTGTTDNPKIILELGAGTALPSLLLAKATTPGSTVLITTDRPNAPHILDNIQRAYQENHISWSKDQHQLQEHKIMVRSLGWGDFTLTNPFNPDGGLLQLLKDVSRINQSKEGICSPGRIDLILGSDTFYNPPGTFFFLKSLLQLELLTYFKFEIGASCLLTTTYVFD